MNKTTIENKISKMANGKELSKIVKKYNLISEFENMAAVELLKAKKAINIWGIRTTLDIAREKIIDLLLIETDYYKKMVKSGFMKKIKIY